VTDRFALGDFAFGNQGARANRTAVVIVAAYINRALTGGAERSRHIASFRHSGMWLRLNHCCYPINRAGCSFLPDQARFWIALSNIFLAEIHIFA
jgi:hypothetical protein